MNVHSVAFERSIRAATAFDCPNGLWVIFATRAICSCGWSFESVDFKRVQELAATHDLDQRENACGQI